MEVYIIINEPLVVMRKFIPSITQRDVLTYLLTYLLNYLLAYC